jgi:hypothetical protein
MGTGRIGGFDKTISFPELTEQMAIYSGKLSPIASPEVWLGLLAWTKALFDATKSTIDLTLAVQKYRNDPDTIRESQRVSVRFSTYSDVVIESFTEKLKGCDERMALQGGGKDRRKCVCSLLNELEEGNNGVPEIDDWENMYKKLDCAKLKV